MRAAVKEVVVGWGWGGRGGRRHTFVDENGGGVELVRRVAGCLVCSACLLS